MPTMKMKKKILETATNAATETATDAATKANWRSLDFDTRLKVKNLYNYHNNPDNLNSAVKESISKVKLEDQPNEIKKAYSMFSEMKENGFGDLSEAQNVLNNGTKKDGIGLWGHVKNHPFISAGVVGTGIYGISEMTDDDPDY